MRLIDAEVYAEEMKKSQDACIKHMNDAKTSGDEETYSILRGAFDALTKAKLTLDAIPTIDAEPVRHGRWDVEIDTGAEMYVCSSCKCRMIKKDYDRATGINAKSFCPYCGAKMDGGENK